MKLSVFIAVGVSASVPEMVKKWMTGFDKGRRIEAMAHEGLNGVCHVFMFAINSKSLCGTFFVLR